MIVEDQSEVLGFLGDPANWGPGVGHIERIDTHGAAVFLGGDRALKLKRAVKFDYMDFSTLQRRKAMCAEEIRLNRRTAPKTYRGVLPITRRAGGGLEFDGPGEPVDWVIDMVRFSQDTLFDRMAQRHALTPDLMVRLADAVARFHEEAEVRVDMGGFADFERTVNVNYAQLLHYVDTVYDPDSVEQVTRRTHAELSRQRNLLERRRRGGFVRHCHGDLHLRNICLVDGEPTLFDAIEFNELFAVSDVLYDLAFLIMDLLHRGLGDLANGLFNRYMARRWDIPGIALLPLSLATRAVVRAHVNPTIAEGLGDAARAEDLCEEGRHYLRQALAYLSPPAPRLIAVGGLSGTGKSTLARALAPSIRPAPGALVLRSDVIRKLLCGRQPEEPLGAESYQPAVSRQVYDRILEGARQAIAAGHSVIADAVYARAEERNAVERLADELAVPFQGVWLEAPDSVLVDRVEGRVHDASDADARVVEEQLGYDVGEVSWARLDAGLGATEVAERAQALIGRGGD